MSERKIRKEEKEKITQQTYGSNLIKKLAEFIADEVNLYRDDMNPVCPHEYAEDIKEIFEQR